MITNDFIILVDSLNIISNISNQIKNQIVLPQRIIFGLKKGENSDAATAFDVREKLLELDHIFAHLKIAYSIVNILETQDDYLCIDTCMKHCNSQYYSVFLNNQFIPNHFNSRVKLLCDEKQIYMIRPQSGIHGLVIHRGIHKLVGGSMSFDEDKDPKWYLDKVTDKIVRHAKEPAIYTWEE